MYLYKSNISHNNLKPSKILITEEGYLQLSNLVEMGCDLCPGIAIAKLSDMSLSEIIENSTENG